VLRRFTWTGWESKAVVDLGLVRRKPLCAVTRRQCGNSRVERAVRDRRGAIAQPRSGDNAGRHVHFAYYSDPLSHTALRITAETMFVSSTTHQSSTALRMTRMIVLPGREFSLLHQGETNRDEIGFIDREHLDRNQADVALR